MWRWWRRRQVRGQWGVRAVRGWLAAAAMRCPSAHLRFSPALLHWPPVTPRNAAERGTPVNPTPPDFNPAAAAAKANISVVANVGDPAALNQAAQSILSLATFGQGSNTTSDADKQALREMLGGKGSELLLASAGSINVRDPEAARAAAASAAGMVSVMTNLTTDTQKAVLSIGQSRE